MDCEQIMAGKPNRKQTSLIRMYGKQLTNSTEHENLTAHKILNVGQ